jgi:predicted lipoprotein with Yx(FWY)xxD motif
VSKEILEADPMNRTRVPAVAAAAAAGLLALTACGEGRAGESRNAGPPLEQQAVKLTAADVGTLGSVVTDQDGLTLYRFDRDTAKPSASNCDGECARIWPPVLVTDPSQVVVASVDRGLIGWVIRTDGSMQLTLGGWPLYHYVEDSKPGDANGQGIGGTWFAATPQGNKALTKAARPEAAPDAGGGY